MAALRAGTGEAARELRARWREARRSLAAVQPSVLYPLGGALFAAGAPLGLLALRRFLLRERTPFRRQIERDPATYLYLAVATPIVFGLFGRVLGQRADRLAELSATDALTGLANARAFAEGLEREVERSRRSGVPLSVLLLDLDHLKALNDRHGHAAGDRALRLVGRAVGRQMRAADLGARVGGDEFGVVAVDADHGAALALAERLHEAIAAERAPGMRVTTSIGVVTFDPAQAEGEDVRRLMLAVDRALYVAKRRGRNRIASGTLDLASPVTIRDRP